MSNTHMQQGIVELYGGKIEMFQQFTCVVLANRLQH